MKICLIGCAGHTAQTVMEMRLCPEAEFVGIAPGGPEEDPAALAAFGIPVYPDYREMLDRLAPQVAVVSPVFGRTGAVLLACAERHIDVFCEKPVAADLLELSKVEKAVLESGIRFSAMHFLRFTPSFYHARQAVREGAVGEIRMITAQKSYKFGQRPAWYKDRALYTGTIPWVGIHAIDWIYYFASRPFRSVKALHVGSPEMTALCQFELEGDILASANIDYYRPSAAPTHGDDRVRVAGTEGVIEVFEDRYVLINRDGVQEFRPTVAPKLAYEFLMGRDPLTPEEIFMITGVALAARDSADKKETILL